MSGVLDIAEAQCNIAAGDARQLLAGFGVALEVPVIQQADPALAADQDRALVVEESLERLGRPPAMVEQALAFVVHDQRRVGKGHEDALRAVLEEPAPARVRGVVARDEFAQGPVADALALDQPVAAPVEVEPAVDRRDVGPLREAANDDFVHAGLESSSGGGMSAIETYLARPWLAHYQKGVPAAVDVPLKSVPQLFDEASERAPDRAAVVFYGRSISFRELREATDRFAAALAALGVKKGERLALYLLNSPQFIIAYFAALKCGATVTPISPVRSEE